MKRSTATDENGDVLEVSESIWPADNVIFVDQYPIPDAATVGTLAFRAGVPVLGLIEQQTSLEDAFLELTEEETQ